VEKDSHCSRGTSTMLSLALDQRDHKCALVLRLLVYLDAKAVISSQDLRGGVLQVAEQLEDIAMDDPHL